MDTKTYAKQVGGVIFVRTYSQTYIARCDGKTASCTAGPEHAAHAVARKVMAGKPFTIKRSGAGEHIWKIVQE